MALTKRPASLVPGKVLVNLTGGDPQTDTERAEKLNWPVHIMHGTAVGAMLAALSLLDLSAGSPQSCSSSCSSAWAGRCTWFSA